VKLQCKRDKNKVKHDKTEIKIKMSTGKVFAEFHFNIIINQDAIFYAMLRTALDIAETNKLRNLSNARFYLSILSPFYLVFISLILQFHIDNTAVPQICINFNLIIPFF
jgi:hypothetical protein